MGPTISGFFFIGLRFFFDVLQSQTLTWGLMGKRGCPIFGGGYCKFLENSTIYLLKKTKINSHHRTINYWIAPAKIIVPHSQLSAYFEPPVRKSMNYHSRVLIHSNGKLLNLLFSVGKSYWKKSVVYGPYLIPWKGYLIVKSVVHHPIEEGWWAPKGLNGQQIK